MGPSMQLVAQYSNRILSKLLFHIGKQRDNIFSGSQIKPEDSLPKYSPNYPEDIPNASNSFKAFSISTKIDPMLNIT